jgi:hypothetical protein
VSVPLPLRLVLTVVAALIALAIIVSGAFALLDEAATKTTIVRTGYGGVRSLEVDDDVGIIELTGAPAGSRLRVVEHVRSGFRGPRRRAERAGGTLHLSAACPDFPGGRCGVRYELAVPSGTSLTIHSGGGDVLARGVAGGRRVLLDSGAGTVRVDGASADVVDLSSAAGDVRATGVRGADRVRAESAAGDVRVKLLDPPRRLNAHSAAGDVDLTVPDVTYAVDASSSAGDVADHDLRTDPDAPRTISATSAAGDVRIGVRR